MSFLCVVEREGLGKGEREGRRKEGREGAGRGGNEGRERRTGYKRPCGSSEGGMATGPHLAGALALYFWMILPFPTSI